MIYRNAMTEVCVLTDVLTIAKQKQYLILDPVPQELPEPKPMAQIYARKKVNLAHTVSTDHNANSMVYVLLPNSSY